MYEIKISNFRNVSMKSQYNYNTILFLIDNSIQILQTFFVVIFYILLWDMQKEKERKLFHYALYQWIDNNFLFGFILIKNTNMEKKKKTQIEKDWRKTISILTLKTITQFFFFFLKCGENCNLKFKHESRIISMKKKKL